MVTRKEPSKPRRQKVSRTDSQSGDGDVPGGRFTEELGSQRKPHKNDAPPPEPPAPPDSPTANHRSSRSTTRHTSTTGNRTERMTSWKKIWSINGFLTPWLSGWIYRFFHSDVLRCMGRQTPWMLIIMDILLAGLIGMTGSGWTKMIFPDNEFLGELEWYAENRDGMRFGAWGYCDAVGDCVVRPFYNFAFPDISGGAWYGVLYSTVFLSGLILSIGLAGVLLFLGGIWALLFRLTSSNESKSFLSCTGCISCIEVRLSQSEKQSKKKEREKGDEGTIPKARWMIVIGWLLWGFLIWMACAGAGLVVLVWLGGMEGLMGESLMVGLLGFAVGWVLVRSIFRSRWAYEIKDEDEEEEDEDEDEDD